MHPYIHPDDRGYNARITKLEEEIAVLKTSSNTQAEEIAALKTSSNTQANVSAYTYNLSSRNAGLSPTHQMQESAAKAQATEHLYAPLRTDTGPLLRLAAFARRLLDDNDQGLYVSEHVKSLARGALTGAEE